MSAAPKFTPGPWRYFKQGDSTRFHVTARPTTKPGNRFDDFATVDIAHEANARLIAAAPELYEALRALLDRWDTQQNIYTKQGEALFERARAALAKVDA
jgi:hypothetical protein